MCTRTFSVIKFNQWYLLSFSSYKLEEGNHSKHHRHYQYSHTFTIVQTLQVYCITVLIRTKKTTKTGVKKQCNDHAKASHDSSCSLKLKTWRHSQNQLANRNVKGSSRPYLGGLKGTSYGENNQQIFSKCLLQ